MRSSHILEKSPHYSSNNILFMHDLHSWQTNLTMLATFTTKICHTRLRMSHFLRLLRSLHTRLSLSIETHFPKGNFIFLPAATCKKKRKGSKVGCRLNDMGDEKREREDEIINIQRHKLSRYQMSHLKGKQRRDERTNINNRTDHPTRIQQWYHIIIIIMTEWSLLERTSATLKKAKRKNNGKSMAQNCQKVYELSTTKIIRFRSFIEKLLIELSILYASLSRCVLQQIFHYIKKIIIHLFYPLFSSLHHETRLKCCSSYYNKNAKMSANDENLLISQLRWSLRLFCLR